MGLSILFRSVYSNRYRKKSGNNGIPITEKSFQANSWRRGYPLSPKKN